MKLKKFLLFKSSIIKLQRAFCSNPFGYKFYLLVNFFQCLYYCEIVEERLNKTVLCRSIGTNLLRKSRDDHQTISKYYSKFCVTYCATYCVAQNKLVSHQVPIIFSIYKLFLFLYFIYYLLYWSYIKGTTHILALVIIYYLFIFVPSIVSTRTFYKER